MMPANSSLPAAAQRLALVDSDYDEPETDVRDLLDTGKSGKPTPSLLNAYTVLAKDSRWQGRLRWSTFEEVVYLDGKPFDDNETTRISLWLDRIYMLRIASENLVRAVNHVAMEHPFHPIREWMDGLVWDGTPRVDGLIATYLRGLPSELNTRLSRAWMIAAVARIYEPGCKFDNLLVLVGDQGEGKSQACAALSPNPNWTAETTFKVGEKDTFQLIQGVWLYEIAELKSLRGASDEAVKAFLSTRKDRFRRPYGRFPEVHLRSVVFIGTTNLDEFLSDETGSRRYWPAYVGVPDIRGIVRDRAQLWAEAVQAYRAGEPWWLDKPAEELLKKVSLRHQVVDAWSAVIADWITDHESFTVEAVLADALNISVDRWDQRKRSRVGGILAHLGCKKMRPDDGDDPRRPRVWHRPAGWTAEKVPEEGS